MKYKNISTYNWITQQREKSLKKSEKKSIQNFGDNTENELQVSNNSIPEYGIKGIQNIHWDAQKTSLKSTDNSRVNLQIPDYGGHNDKLDEKPNKKSNEKGFNNRHGLTKVISRESTENENTNRDDEDLANQRVNYTWNDKKVVTLKSEMNKEKELAENDCYSNKRPIVHIKD